MSNGLDPDQDRHFGSGSKLFAKVFSRRRLTASKERDVESQSSPFPSKFIFLDS